MNCDSMNDNLPYFLVDRDFIRKCELVLANQYQFEVNGIVLINQRQLNQLNSTHYPIKCSCIIDGEPDVVWHDVRTGFTIDGEPYRSYPITCFNYHEGTNPIYLRNDQ